MEEFLYLANIQMAHVFVYPFSTGEWVHIAVDGLFGSGAECQRASALPACLICNQDFIEFDGSCFLSDNNVPHAHWFSFLPNLHECNLNTQRQKHINFSDFVFWSQQWVKSV